MAILDLCRNLYNAALQERRDAWQKAKKSIGFAEQNRSSTEVRRDDSDYAALPRHLTTNVLQRLDNAFAAFFRRVKSGEEPGYPRFRSRNRYDSFGWDAPPGTGWSLEGKNLRIGDLRVHVRFHNAPPTDAKLLGFRVKREGPRWYVNLVFDLGAAPAKRAVASAVGIDLGIESFATLSDGGVVENPRFLKRSLDKLAVAQQALAKKPKRRSRRRDVAKAVVAKIYRKIENQRDNFLHTVSRALIRRYDLIAYENLNIEGMLERGETTPAAMVGLHRGITDAAWGKLIWMLRYKAECAGTWAVPVDPRGTSQTCSRCGARVPKELWERMHLCDACGLEVHRDLNASYIVYDRGLRSARMAGAVFVETFRSGLGADPECR